MQINGKEYDCHDISISALLKTFEIKARFLVVEVNKIIVEKDMYDEQMLKKDDKIEIVSFVGGG
jgi:sulfur carrier protein